MLAINHTKRVFIKQKNDKGSLEFYLQMPSRIYKDAEHSGTHGGHAQQLCFQQNLLQFIRIGGEFVPLQTHVKITVLGFLQS